MGKASKNGSPQQMYIRYRPRRRKKSEEKSTRGLEAILKNEGGGVGYFPKAIISVSKIAWLGH
jgi:hypothetical protein